MLSTCPPVCACVCNISTSNGFLKIRKRCKINCISGHIFPYAVLLLRRVAGHLIYAGSSAAAAHHWQAVFAGHLQTGNYVIVNDNHNSSSGGGGGRVARVVRVSWSRDRRAGAYAPITSRGTLVVDDVIVSCYAELASDWAAHLALAPLRYLYDAVHLCHVTADWLGQTTTGVGRWQPGTTPVDGVHWYGALLWRLAGAVLPASYWWPSA